MHGELSLKVQVNWYTVPLGVVSGMFNEAGEIETMVAAGSLTVTENVPLLSVSGGATFVVTVPPLLFCPGVRKLG